MICADVREYATPGGSNVPRSSILTVSVWFARKFSLCIVATVAPQNYILTRLRLSRSVIVVGRKVYDLLETVGGKRILKNKCASLGIYGAATGKYNWKAANFTNVENKVKWIFPVRVFLTAFFPPFPFSFFFFSYSLLLTTRSFPWFLFHLVGGWREEFLCRILKDLCRAFLLKVIYNETMLLVIAIVKSNVKIENITGNIEKYWKKRWTRDAFCR